MTLIKCFLLQLSRSSYHIGPTNTSYTDLRRLTSSEGPRTRHSMSHSQVFLDDDSHLKQEKEKKRKGFPFFKKKKDNKDSKK